MNSWPRFAIVSDFDSVDLSPEWEHTLTLPHATGATMNLTDRELKCAECGEMFVFSAGEQEFFQRKGFTNEPKRCKQCKAKRQGGGGNDVGESGCHSAGAGIARGSENRSCLCDEFARRPNRSATVSRLPAHVFVPR